MVHKLKYVSLANAATLSDAKRCDVSAGLMYNFKSSVAFNLSIRLQVSSILLNLDTRFLRIQNRKNFKQISILNTAMLGHSFCHFICYN